MRRITSMLVIAITITISQTTFATTVADIPDLNTYNWQLADDFSDLNYSLNNWTSTLPSKVRFGINTYYEHGYMFTDETINSFVTYAGNVIPTQSDDICGISADISLQWLSTNSYCAAYYCLGFNIASNASVYWGLRVIGTNEIEGTLLFRQDNKTYIVPSNADFTAAVGQTYKLAIAFSESANEYYFYFNGEKKEMMYFPEAETSFFNAHLRMSTKRASSRFTFDNIQFATTPEPITMALLGLGSLLIRKRY